MRTSLLTFAASIALAACSGGGSTNGTTGPGGATTGGATSGAGASSGASSGGSTSGASATGSGASATGTGTGATTGSAAASGTTGSLIPAGTLWVEGSNAIDPSSLTQSGTPPFSFTCAPVAGLSTSAQGGAELVDGNGNLWTQFYTSTPTNALYKWTPTQLSQSCSSRRASATFDIQATLTALAFDGSGNLWGSSPQSNSVIGYQASDLADGGSIGAAFLLSENPGKGTASLFSPTGLAFDSDGTLWIGNYYSVLGYKEASLQLAGVSGGNPLTPPDFVLTNSTAQSIELDGGLYNDFIYQYLAFDSSHDLWVTVQNGTSDPATYQILEFTQDQLGNLATNNTPAPVFTITETIAQQSQSFPGWSAIAFDSNGNLWGGAHLAAPNLFRFPALSLTGNGAPDYLITAGGDIDGSVDFTMAFDPIPTGLPLRPGR